MEIERIIENAVNEKAATGIAISFVTENKTERFVFGKTEENGTDINEKTLFDLASLTKSIFTAPLTLKFAEEGILSINDSVSYYLKGFPEEITIRSLLTHTSGIAAWLPLYKKIPIGEPKGESVKNITLQEAVEKIKMFGIKRKPFEKVEYSCMGYILLGAILEKVSGKNLKTISEEFFESMSMKDTGFLPKGDDIAATESVNGTRLKGIVHDENARALSGVSTNAGLFSNVTDLEKFVRVMLKGGASILSPFSVNLMREKQTGNLIPERTIGWLKGRFFNGAPDFAPEDSIGHSGFTGTSIFIDFENEYGVIILTNRVYYGRENKKHIRLRRIVSNTFYGRLR